MASKSFPTFVALPFDFVRERGWAALSPKAKAVLVPLYSRVRAGGSFAVGQRLLAADAGLDHRCVPEAIRELVAVGLITVEHSAGRRARYTRPWLLGGDRAAPDWRSQIPTTGDLRSTRKIESEEIREKDTLGARSSSSFSSVAEEPTVPFQKPNPIPAAVQLVIDLRHAAGAEPPQSEIAALSLMEQSGPAAFAAALDAARAKADFNWHASPLSWLRAAFTAKQGASDEQCKPQRRRHNGSKRSAARSDDGLSRAAFSRLPVLRG